jgi:gluconate 2-dehydrogenase alpha chain
MATTLPKTDIVIVGGGATGLVAAYELCHAGYKCVVLERGKFRTESPDFQAPEEHDELKYDVHYRHMIDLTQQTLTFRNNTRQTALPMRQMGSFLPGEGVGGSMIHWNGQFWRPLPSDLKLRSHYEERYGKNFIPAELTIQDYPFTYDELEPHLTFMEKVFAASGRAANVKGKPQGQGNVFEGMRSEDYPNPPMKQHYAGKVFEDAARELGKHPFIMPSGDCTVAYKNPYGAQLHPCTYCGFCEKFGCGYYAKADPIVCVLNPLRGHPNFDLRAKSYVLKVEKTADGKLATGVTYLNLLDGQEYFQPADTVLVCAFPLWTVHLMLYSGIGQPYDPDKNEGVVGRNYAYQTMGGVNVFFDETVRTNPFMGAGAMGTIIDDLNGDNFDHGPLGFVGGGWVGPVQTNGRPIHYQPVPKPSKNFGAEFKQAMRENYLRHAEISAHGSCASSRGNYLSLDPTYKDAFGRPLLRMTFDFTENDRKMMAHVLDETEKIAKTMKHVRKIDKTNHAAFGQPYSLVPYQTTHNVGGAAIGDNPKTSAVNRYGQSWDVSNVFVFGAALYPQNLGYNPTGTLLGITYWTLDHMKNDYLKNPRPLVQA